MAAARLPMICPLGLPSSSKNPSGNVFEVCISGGRSAIESKMLRRKEGQTASLECRCSLQYYYSNALMWFVVANAVAFSDVSGISGYRPTAIAYVGKNGLSKTEWSPICNRFHRYYAHVLGVITASYLGWLYLTCLVIAALHRRQ